MSSSGSEYELSPVRGGKPKKKVARGRGRPRKQKESGTMSLKDSGYQQRTDSELEDDSCQQGSSSSSKKKNSKKGRGDTTNCSNKSQARGSVNTESSDLEDSDSEAYSSSSSSDCMEPIFVKRRKIKRETSESKSTVGDADSVSVCSKETLPVSPTPSSIGSNETSIVKAEPEPDLDRSGENSDSDSDEKDGSESPETPEDQWEIERIINYVKDDFGELYHVKWKDWDECFNTWEPRSNLLNCEQELIRFRKERKQEAREALERSEYIVLPNGKRRRHGPRIPDVPPDPRPLDDIVQDFFNVVGSTPDTKYIYRTFQKWKAKMYSAKSRLSNNILYQMLDDGIEGRLNTEEIRVLTKELVLREVETKANQLKSEIKRWESEINSITGSKPHITIENNVDLMGPPIGFKFVNEYVAGEGVEIPKDPPVGCACGTEATSCYDSRNGCCASQFGYKYAYTKYKKVNVLQGSPIYECNSKCQCDDQCPNRVVQDGKSDHKFSIFRTDDGRGWGVKTLKSIKKGSFVTLYVGEVIKSEEANRRGKIYDETGFTYLFDLDFNDPENYPYSVDASKYGNVAHFINHSCMPNLAVYAVWTDCLDPNLPKLALFATKDIARDEELTFDYNVQLSSESRSRRKDADETIDDEDATDTKRVVCLCGTPKCRKYIF